MAKKTKVSNKPVAKVATKKSKSKMLTTTDIANSLQVRPVTIHRRVVDGSFPEPDDVRGRVRYWEAATVNAWKKENKATIKAMRVRSDRRKAA